MPLANIFWGKCQSSLSCSKRAEMITLNSSRMSGFEISVIWLPKPYIAISAAEIAAPR